jgi:YD repeat-containing protein
MRLFRLLAVLTAALPTGCTALVASVGTDTRRFDTRDQVRAEFGPPDETGEKYGEPFDQYRTRRKIVNSLASASLGEGWAMTFGLIELVAFPRELAQVSEQMWNGQDLRFEYDASGRVLRVFLDGATSEWPPYRQH